MAEQDYQGRPTPLGDAGASGGQRSQAGSNYGDFRGSQSAQGRMPEPQMGGYYTGGDRDIEGCGRTASSGGYAGPQQGSDWGQQMGSGYAWRGYGSSGFGPPPGYGQGPGYDPRYGYAQGHYGQQGHAPGYGNPAWGDPPHVFGVGGGGNPQQRWGPQQGYGGEWRGDWGHAWQGGPMGYGAEHGHEHYDADYHQWRNEQLRNLDNDYRSWREDRYRKFSEEFGRWRSGRSAPAGSSGSSTEDTGSASSNAGTTTGGSSKNR
ncbi:MAG TPA: hypothetical protein VLU41_15765 [Ideonella sp.]|nr:hypothetical protein [Ideonella sp.]